MENFARLFEIDGSQLLVTVEPDGDGSQLRLQTKIDRNLIAIGLDTMPYELAMTALEAIDEEQALNRLNQIRDIYKKAMAGE